MSVSVERFKAISPSEFFYRNKELAGFANPARALYQAVREFVENSLDATDAHGILPNIKVMIDRDQEKENVYTITVEDNGIGIPPHYVPQAFGQVLFSSKYILRQTRGMFGLGAKMVVLYGQITVGRPVEIYTSPIKSSRIYYFKMLIDIRNNTPNVLERSSWHKESNWHGTRVKVSLLGDWSRSKSRIVEYIRRTALIAPYATILFRDPDGNTYIFRRVTDKIPPPPKEVKPHPHGVDLEMLRFIVSISKAKTVKELLMKEFQGVGSVTAERILEQAGIDPRRSPKKLTRSDLVKLADTLKTFSGFRRPSADHLSPIGSDLIELGLKTMFNSSFVKAITRKPTAYEGHAVIVEVGVAFGGKIKPAKDPNDILLLRFANKIPLLYDERTDVAFKVVSGIDWKEYSVDFPSQIAVLVHVCSTKIPYKGVGKESVADVPEIEAEIRRGLREILRSLRTYIHQVRRAEEIKRRAYTLIKYIPEISRGLAIIGYDGNPSKGIEILESKLFELVKRKVNVKGIRSVRDVVVEIE